MTTSAADINPDRGHLKALDGVRGLAVLMVMVFHYFQRESFPASRIVNALVSVSHIGQTGVDLFFVLSGFLITGILLHTKDKPTFFRNFYARRALRIFPLAYIALLVVYFLFPLAQLTTWTSWNKQIWFWLYASNLATTFWPQSVAGPGHFWSLAIEEQFYLVWPTVVWLCSRRSLYRTCIACLIISFVSRMILLKLGYKVFYFTFCRLDGLALGAMLANFVRGPRGFAGLKSLRPNIWLCVLFVLLVPLWIGLTGKRESFGELVKYPLIAVLYCTLLAAAINPAHPAVGRMLSNRAFVTLGKYSYGLYVWDGIIQKPMSRFISTEVIALHLHGMLHQSIVIIAIGIVVQFSVAFAVALISWNLMEKQFLKLKTFFEYDTRPPAAPKTQGNQTEQGEMLGLKQGQ